MHPRASCSRNASASRSSSGSSRSSASSGGASRRSHRPRRAAEMSTALVTGAEPTLQQLVDNAVVGLNDIILGKETQVRLWLACLLARGHLLIEDIPGVGKTTLAHALARTLGLSYQRIQFTSDLLPADIIGVSVFEADTGQFRFHRGPVFAQLVLADEVNRATPKAQSA